ncbi:MAG: hypothetical protein WD250_06290 [Egibacteraceae bacterium]
MSDLPLPHPFGAPRGPEVTTPDLFARWVGGSTAGVSPDAHLEGCLLLAGDHPLAIRIEGAVLVRDHLPDAVHALRGALERFLETQGLALIEQDAPLGALVGIEVSGLRGDAWSLWARDPDEGHAALVQRAAADMPGLLDGDEARRRAEVDATLAEIERHL